MAIVQVPAPLTGSLTLLSTTSLTGNSVSVSSISQSYKNLFFIFRDVYASANDKTIYMTTSSLYGTFNYIYGDGSTFASENNLGQLYMPLVKKMGTASNAEYRAAGSFTITNYATTATKTISGNSIALNNSGVRSGGTLAGYWYTTSAINEITVYLVGADTFSGGQLLIYGVN